jgi:acid stress-induced BolA-like protein IbaG/YrbA
MPGAPGVVPASHCRPLEWHNPGAQSIMTEQQIVDLVRAAFPDAQVRLGGDGYHHELTVISETFAGLRAVQRQQRVYAALADAIRSGAVHAVNVVALTGAEAAAGAR